jgi:hypothetical protein
LGLRHCLDHGSVPGQAASVTFYSVVMGESFRPVQEWLPSGVKFQACRLLSVAGTVMAAILAAVGARGGDVSSDGGK